MLPPKLWPPLREEVPDCVLKAYNESELSFGRDYIIPKPFDPRVILLDAAVAEAAINSYVANRVIDLDEYQHTLKKLMVI